MPEYLAPGVYVEEVSFRSKSIEGVPTSTTGVAGLTRYGPVPYPNGPKTTEPRLITSFTEFESVYGGLTPLRAPTIADERLGYVAHAARAFFMNGGTRLYVSRVFSPRGISPNFDYGVAALPISVSGTTAAWTARWPGELGNAWIDVQVVRSKHAAYQAPEFGNAVQVNGAKLGSIVEVITAGTPPVGNAPLVLGTLAQVSFDPNDGRQIFSQGGAPFLPNASDVIQNVTLRVTVRTDEQNSRAYEGLETDPATKRYVGKILQADNPEDENAIVYLAWDPAAALGNDVAANLMVALQANSGKRLTGGHDGIVPNPADLAGQDADPDDPNKKATGLAALGEVDDIAIVALPDSGDLGNLDSSLTAVDALIIHAETLRYRIAVVDPPPHCSMTQIRSFRGQFDSEYAALYHPWIEILDPTERPAQGAPPRRLTLPPSGFVAGIYARTDILRGVYKAPANEVVNGLTKFEININKPRQDVLNPEGINALRFFEGRGNRVWGARTMSSDPEWKYVNVRRLFIYLEHSIDKGTQWAVFEPNNERLWANIRSTIEDFLLVQWKSGALMGSKPEEAFFVRCDRTTMTQNDLDNGRLICLIGVAPTYPAEFVIFRIGQWTADSKS
jgi:Bacteriophage tail sheath protein